MSQTRLKSCKLPWSGTWQQRNIRQTSLTVASFPLQEQSWMRKQNSFAWTVMANDNIEQSHTMRPKRNPSSQAVWWATISELLWHLWHQRSRFWSGVGANGRWKDGESRKIQRKSNKNPHRWPCSKTQKNAARKCGPQTVGQEILYACLKSV